VQDESNARADYEYAVQVGGAICQIFPQAKCVALLQKLLDSPDLNQCGAEAYPMIDYILRSKMVWVHTTYHFVATSHLTSEQKSHGASGQVEK
jgi:hypothetical protein